SFTFLSIVWLISFALSVLSKTAPRLVIVVCISSTESDFVYKISVPWFSTFLACCLNDVVVTSTSGLTFANFSKFGWCGLPISSASFAALGACSEVGLPVTFAPSFKRISISPELNVANDLGLLSRLIFSPEASTSSFFVVSLVASALSALSEPLLAVDELLQAANSKTTSVITIKMVFFICISLQLILRIIFTYVYISILIMILNVNTLLKVKQKRHSSRHHRINVFFINIFK